MPIPTYYDGSTRFARSSAAGSCCAWDWRRCPTSAAGCRTTAGCPPWRPPAASGRPSCAPPSSRMFEDVAGGRPTLAGGGGVSRASDARLAELDAQLVTVADSDPYQEPGCRSTPIGGASAPRLSPPPLPKSSYSPMAETTTSSSSIHSSSTEHGLPRTDIRKNSVG